MNNYKLYLHTAPNGKRYYGITKQDPKRRWLNGAGYKNNQYFYRAIEKYGWDNIEHIILFDDLTESEAKELEQYFIQWYQTANREYGYNISLGGEGGNHSEETKQKLSKINKGKSLSEEHKQKMSEAHKGINNPMHGRTGTNCPISKSVICITTNKIFSTIKEGAEYYKISNSHIGQCCKGKRKSAGKYNGQKLVWKYVNYKHDKVFKIKAM